MTELRITRARDIALYLNDEPMYGVTHFRAVSQGERHAVGEYLSGEPVAVVNTGMRHELSLRVLSLFSPSGMDEDGFTITARDGDAAYQYDGCTVTRCERDAEGEKNLTVSYTIAAKKLTKRRIPDAG